MKHRKQEIAGLAFFLFALVSVLIYAKIAKADPESDASASRSACQTWYTNCDNHRLSCLYTSQTLIGNITDAEDTFQQVQQDMTQADINAFNSALNSAINQWNQGELYRNVGWNTEVHYSNPLGGTSYQAYADNYWSIFDWLDAKANYDVATNKYQSANGSFNTADTAYNSSQSFTNDAWDILGKYTP